MIKFLKSVPGIICIVALALIVLAAAGLGGYTYWHYRLVKFQNVTIELGQEFPEISAFMTENAMAEKVRMVTPENQIDLKKVGRQDIILSHGSKLETVALIIQDTTPPTALFHDVTADIDAVLTPADFVTEVTDLSETTVEFATPLTPPESYGDVSVDLVVTDAYGNRFTGSAYIYYVWMYKTFTLELGDTLEKADLLLNPEKDGEKLDQAVLDEINASPVGTYTVTSTDGNQSSSCIVTVQDTVPPELTLRAVTIDAGESVSKDSFFDGAYDVSGEVTVNLLSKWDCNKLGTQEIVFEAVDINGNKTTLSTTLTVNTDTKPPVFSGVEDMKVKKNSSPDYEVGVKATDTKDGEVEFTCDASRVDLTSAGIYYVVYTASDSKGNTATYRRKVEVKRDASDTAALVNSVAANLSNSAEAIRDYVRSSIGYSSSWGEDDAVWYGLKNKSGNCYVHAAVLDALLRAKGYSTQLIWCQDKSHYWNLVYIDGGWKHIDSTPSDHTHNKYSLMNDEQRYETLTGRDWDREAWPECP